MRAVLADAGALIAVLDRDDAHHARAVAALARVRRPLVTVWPALTEAMHLLSGVPRGQAALFDMATSGGISILDLGATDLVRMKELVQKYRDLPMDFADAAIVRAAERDGLTELISFDKHFAIYRLPRRARFTILA